MPRWGGRARAAALTKRGGRLLHLDRAGAEAAYRQAVALDPELHEAWFDLGLIYKWARRWEDAFDCNLRAAELVGEQRDEPAWWNLGIAATALHRWDVARRAWRAYGLSIEDGEGEPDGDLGLAPVRLDPDGGAEVVWGRRIDPARIRLANVPFPSSGHRWGDVVLHDGAPNGYRELRGKQVPVFDELERWRPSDIPTLEAAVTAPSQGDLDRLLASIDAAGFMTEDWTSNTRALCKHCSEGFPSTDHAHASAAPDDGDHLVGIAAPFAEATALVREWERETGGTCRILASH